MVVNTGSRHFNQKNVLPNHPGPARFFRTARSTITRRAGTQRTAQQYWRIAANARMSRRVQRGK